MLLSKNFRAFNAHAAASVDTSSDLGQTQRSSAISKLLNPFAKSQHHSASLHRKHASDSISSNIKAKQNQQRRSKSSKRMQALSGSPWDDFEVVGNKIYDPNGREFIAKGVNINGPGFSWPGDTPNQVNNVKKWGFNAIRLNVQEIYPSQYKYAENGTIDQIVQNFTSQGIVVMIEPHEHTGGWFSNDLNKLVDWHKSLATKYKDNPYVWLNVSNEPGGSDSGSSTAIDKYLNQNISVIKAIRSTGFDNPIVADGWFWGQDVGAWNSNPVSESKSAILSLGQKVLAADPLKNTIFSVHTYDQWQNNTRVKMDDFINRAEAKGLAMILGEYGAETGGKFKDVVSGVLPSAQQKEIGRFAWAWHGGDLFDLTTSGSAAKATFSTTGSMPNNLTWYGQQVWNDNRRSENLQYRSSTSTPTPTPTPIPAPTTTTLLEAEKMSLSGYAVQSGTFASGGSYVGLSNATIGTASTAFSGTSGKYDVVLGYFDESDGQSRFTVKVGGSAVGSIVASQSLGETVASAKTMTSQVVARGITINKGQQISIEGLKDQEEYARFDYVKLVPVQ